jgi:hypothetical protein
LRACWTPWSVFQDGSGKSLVVNAAILALLAKADSRHY